MSQPRSVTSDIVVGIIGNVSAGKTTLLNALLKDRYGEVSMKRCTAGINFFRFLSRPPGSSGDRAAGTQAADTQAAIRRINVALRREPKVERSDFEVSTEPFIHMRPSANLVVADVPGLNESKTAKMYQDYVRRELFPELDCVILVVDVNQGVNTEEAKSLFELVRDSVREKHYAISVVVVINKIDDKDDPEYQEMAKETEAEARHIFRGTHAILDFVPMSAELAYVYATITDIDNLERCPVVEDPKYLKRIGKEELGRVFGELSRAEQVEALQERLRRPGELLKRFHDCNFQMLVDVLAVALSFEAQKRILIAKVHHDIDVCVSDALQSTPQKLADYALHAVEHCDCWLKMLRKIEPKYGGNTIVSAFSTMWEECIRTCVKELKRSPNAQDLTIDICLSVAAAFLKDFMPLMEPDAHRRAEVADRLVGQMAGFATLWLNGLCFQLGALAREKVARQKCAEREEETRVRDAQEAKIKRELQAALQEWRKALRNALETRLSKLAGDILDVTWCPSRLARTARDLHMPPLSLAKEEPARRTSAAGRQEAVSSSH